jgi:hypothetical protein
LELASKPAKQSDGVRPRHKRLTRKKKRRSTRKPQRS